MWFNLPSPHTISRLTQRIWRSEHMVSCTLKTGMILLKPGSPSSLHKLAAPNYILDITLVMCFRRCAPHCTVVLVRELQIWYRALRITQICHLTAFWRWAFDLPLDQFSALSKPISQSQPLTWVSETREGPWQYQWTQIISQCKHTDKTDVAWPTHSRR